MLRNSRDTSVTHFISDPYAVLGLSQHATRQDVRRAYYALAKRFHPDKHVGKSIENIAAAANQFTHIKAAYDEIIFPHEKNNENLIQGTDKSAAISAGENKQWADKCKEDILEELDCEIEKYRFIPNTITEKALLWIAEKDNCAPIYLFSSLHIFTMDKDDIFGDAIDNIIDKVDVVCTEVHLVNEFEEEAIKLGEMPTSDPSMDTFIAQRAYRRGKYCCALEDAAIREACGVDMKKPHVTNIPEEVLQKFLQNYLIHVSPSSRVLSINHSTTKRTIYWMPKILFLSKDKKLPTLVVDGATHNAGKYGLPNLLASEGYKLTPLMKTAPIPRSSLLSMTARQSFSFFDSIIEEQNNAANKAVVVYRKNGV